MQDIDSLHRDLMVCDFTLPFADIGSADKKEQVLPRFAASGVDCVSVTVGGDSGSLGETVKLIARERARVLAEPDAYVLAGSVEDIRRAKASGKMAVVLHFQGTDALDGQLSMVETYYALGVRHMLLSYNTRNACGSGCFEPEDEGLTAFGEAVVREMNRVGMLVDCSHTGQRTSLEAVALSTAPVICSHANAHSVHPHPRNISDELILACAGTGGVIGVLGVSNMLGPDEEATVEQLAKHIDHIVGLTGIDHVGVSLDYVYDPEATYVWAVEQAGGSLPADGNYSIGMTLLGPEDYPRLTAVLLERGYSESDVRKIMGENWLNVAARVWK